VILAIGCLISMTAGGYAYAQSKKAQRAQRFAEEQARYADGQAALARDKSLEAATQKAFAEQETARVIVARDKADKASQEALKQQKRAEASARQAQENLIEANKQRAAAQLASERFVTEGFKRLALSAAKDGNEKGALENWNQLLMIYRKSNDQAGIASTLISIADIYKLHIPFSSLIEDFPDIVD